MKQMGHTNCEYLEVVPAKLVVVHRIDEAVKCPLDGTIVAAPAPPRIVEKGVLGNRLIIEATADKFLEHLPVERQCTRLKRGGVDVSPSTLGRAVVAHLDLLSPLADAIHDKTRQPGLLATDATGLPVLDRDSPEGIRSGTMWAWTNALWVSFFYSPTGESLGVKEFLGEGNLGRDVQADGTNTLTFIERAGELKGSFFTHALVSGLLGAADANSDGRISLDEAYRHAYHMTLRRTSQTQAGAQHPTYQYDFKGRDALILTRVAHARRGTLGFPTGLSFLILGGGPDGGVVAEVAANAPARHLSLPPGEYFLRGRAKDGLYEGLVEVEAAQTTAVDLAELEPIRYARWVRKGGASKAHSQALQLSGMARTRLPNAAGPCWGGQLGYRLDLAPASCSSASTAAAVSWTTAISRARPTNSPYAGPGFTSGTLERSARSLGWGSEPHSSSRSSTCRRLPSGKGL